MAREDKYDLWAAAFPDAVIITTQHGDVVFWNDAAREIFGYSADEVEGRNVLDLIVPAEERAAHLHTLEEGLHHGISAYESIRRRKDGSMVIVNVSVRRINNTGATPHILFAKKDVTRIKAQSDGRLMEARFRDLLESTPDAVVIANRTGHVVIANTQAETLFGYPAGALNGIAVDSLLPERLRRAHVRHRADYASQPRKRSMGTGLDLAGLRKDGSEFPVEVSLSPLRTEDSTFVMSAIRDVSERRRIERDLHEKNLALARASQAKDAFFASMSHELRTPLNAIIGFTGTLLMRLPGPLNAEQEQQLRIVQSSSQHLLSLINDLLQIARIDADKVDLHPERVDLGALLRNAIASFEVEARNRDLVLAADIADPGIVASTDPRAFTQIAINLIGNALKFTPAGRVDVTLRRARAPPPAAVELLVRDTGPGIAALDRERLFNAFERIAGEGEVVAGTGLGLFLSRKLARSMGGDITCISGVGTGSTFTLTLPER